MNDQKSLRCNAKSIDDFKNPETLLDLLKVNSLYAMSNLL